jgi:uncharacterized SAM-binding protein YcdF (DUF218 family)
VFAASLVGVLYFLIYPAGFAALGRALVRDDGPAAADIAVVLGGDTYGHRILKAAEMVAGGYVPAVLVSGPPGLYGHHEDELAIAFAIKHGCPAQWFIGFPHEALSTEGEALVVLPELRRRGVHRFLLVTSDYHTARGARIFAAADRRLRTGLQMRVVAATDEFYRPGAWWRERQARKIFAIEWIKTAGSALGM